MRTGAWGNSHHLPPPFPHLISVEETGVSEGLDILVKVTELPSGRTGTGAQMSVSKIGPVTTQNSDRVWSCGPFLP